METFKETDLHEFAEITNLITQVVPKAKSIGILKKYIDDNDTRITTMVNYALSNSATPSEAFIHISRMFEYTEQLNDNPLNAIMLAVVPSGNIIAPCENEIGYIADDEIDDIFNDLKNMAGENAPMMYFLTDYQQNAKNPTWKGALLIYTKLIECSLE